MGLQKKYMHSCRSDKVQLAGADSKTVEMENVDANSGFVVTPNGVTIQETYEGRYRQRCVLIKSAGRRSGNA